MESNSNSELPADVVEEILARLPVKSLLRFKCVCKHWYTLIGSRSFVSRHFGHKSNQDRLLVWHYKPDEDRLAFALFFDDICSGYEEPDHLRMPDTVDDLIGPVNGIFCVVGLLRKMALLNPAMRQFKPFLAPRPDVQPHLSSVDNVLGFGFDSLSGDYKLVQIQYFWNHEMNDRHDSSLVSVYNSGTDSWRHFEDVGFLNSSYRAYRSLCNTYLDGVCYWLMKYNYGNVASVLAFDLTTEKFQEIQVPNCIELKKWDLALYRDSIALLSYDLDKIDKCIDIWVMEKERCWTKSSTVGPFQDIRWPICLWKNDELLLETGTSVLTLCNVFTQKLRTVGTQGNKNDLYVDWVCSYKESLVSINGEGGDCVLWDTSSDFVKEFFNY